jgi:hypothetical protein
LLPLAAAPASSLAARLAIVSAAVQRPAYTQSHPPPTSEFPGGFSAFFLVFSCYISAFFDKNR